MEAINTDTIISIALTCLSILLDLIIAVMFFVKLKKQSILIVCGFLLYAFSAFINEIFYVLRILNVLKTFINTYGIFYYLGSFLVLLGVILLPGQKKEQP